MGCDLRSPLLFDYMDINSNITSIKGVGAKSAELFNKLGVETIYDLIHYYPRAYCTYPQPESSISNICGDEYCAIEGICHKSLITKKTARMDITLGTVNLGDDQVDLVWFRQPYIKSKVSPGKRYIFYGMVRMEKGRYKMEQPAVYIPEEYRSMTTGLYPVYSLTKGLTNSKIGKMVDSSFGMIGTISDHLCDDIRKKAGLYHLREALYHIHFPDDEVDRKKARERLAFDEFFDLSMILNLEIGRSEKEPNTFKLPENKYSQKVASSLPFELTEGQKSTLSDIESDITGDVITQRLVQGDVGSGKTVIAFLAMTRFAENGYQSVIMAPTEVLAWQHYETFQRMIKEQDLPFKAVLLTGSMKAAEKRTARELIASGEANFVIGTHALFQDSVTYHDLGLVITDEQHRFGVKQRKALTGKGGDVFSIVMSATPIPRTLAMILYAGMNISVIPSLPAERLPVKNAVVGKDKREASYRFIAKEIAAGHQAMIICPMIEASMESDKTDRENVEEYAKTIRPYFDPSVSIGILHGRLEPNKKDKVLSDFAAGKIHIIISTTVIEVGVNVPNATVMMIENANCFGLSQLHQLRGRVGRGAFQSYCILVCTSDDKDSMARLNILASSNDGFFIANEDLKLRGAGDMLGVRQSGDMSFKIADIYADSELLVAARDAALDLLAKDPELTSDEGSLIASHLHEVRKHQFTNL